jgi:GMP synthase-like glutamine amidotransferase
MLLVMGGPMNIHEESRFPWLKEEKQLIRCAIEHGKRLFGVCLGAQLMADQLGASVTRAKETEIGWFPVERSGETPSELPIPEQLIAYHWHGDRFAIPPGATHILKSVACHEQGFLFRDRVLGLQCHLETTPAAMEALIDACGNEITDAPYIQSPTRMRAEPPDTYARMHSVLFELLNSLEFTG